MFCVYWLGVLLQGAAHMADGYARASGRVGVALATSGPGATNLVTGIATAMLDSMPMVCITGQVASKFIGSDAFQETDITGVTLPITKHNYLVTRAEDIAPMLRAGVLRRAIGSARARCSSTSPRTPSRRRVDFEWDGGPVRLPGYRPEHRAARRGRASARSTLIDARRAPDAVLRATASSLPGRASCSASSSSKTGIPVASTLLGLGGFPATHPLCSA